MDERSITPKIVKWLKAHANSSMAVEVKVTKTNTINLKALKEHQERALTIAKSSTVSHKIIDAGSQNPFDIFVLKNTPAYIAVYFYSFGCKEFYLVPVEYWTKCRLDDIKSFTKEDLYLAQADGVKICVFK